MLKRTNIAKIKNTYSNLFQSLHLVLRRLVLMTEKYCINVYANMLYMYVCRCVSCTSTSTYICTDKYTHTIHTTFTTKTCLGK